ncbi:MAG TPA: carboxypeptidase regulatory-like domain-containing protein, partial [Pyrinomonadaceae bacterium]
MKSVSSRLVFLFLFTHFSLLQIAAQDLDTATIKGLVQDQNGGVIPGAAVEVTLLKTHSKRNAITDAVGRYRVIQLEPGSYSVRISSSGFAAVDLKDVSTIAGQTLQLDTVLAPATVNAETVVVSTIDAPTIDTHRTVVGTTLTTRETQLLPLASRSVFDLIFTLPGVTEEPLSTRDLAEDRNSSPNNTPEEAGVFSLAGAPAYSNNLTIDGLDNNDDRAARERFQPPLEAVEEVQVITNQFSAEYGRASGGRVNFRTRSGSTDFRGRALYFFRDEALDANTFKNNSLGLSRLPFQEHVGGFTFSGPIKLPRRNPNSVFFVGYELNR